MALKAAAELLTAAACQRLILDRKAPAALPAAAPRGLPRLGSSRLGSVDAHSVLSRPAMLPTVKPCQLGPQGCRGGPLKRKGPAVCGAFRDAPKRTRTSTRLSRTRPSALPLKWSGGAEPCCGAISRPARGRFDTPTSVTKSVTQPMGCGSSRDGEGGETVARTAAVRRLHLERHQATRLTVCVRRSCWRDVDMRAQRAARARRSAGSDEGDAHVPGRMR